MRAHTQAFKDNIKLLGKEIDSKIIYGQTELGSEELNSVTPHYEGALLKSTMKQLDIDSNVNIPLNTILNYQFGVKVGNQYEYIDFGNYEVYEVEKQEDTKSYKITCYDKMLKAMKPYKDMGITYPITIRNYINAICTYLGITFANTSDTFTNYNKEIPNELYLDANGNDLGYTFRDVLDELSEVTASTICINNDDELEIRYIQSEEEPTQSKNMLNKSLGFRNGYINTSGNFVSQNFTATFNHKIEVEVGETYCFSTNTNVDNLVISMFGENDTYKTRTKISNTDRIVQLIPNNVSYIYVAVNYNNRSTMTSSIIDDLEIMVEHNNTRTEPYEDYDEATSNSSEQEIEEIDEEYLKDINVNFGEKFGPINSVVLSRSANSDNIVLTDDESIETNGLCEMKISDNQILNFNNRDEYLEEIFEKLNGIEFYLNDYKSTGITYLELCDRYNVKIEGNTYSCVMFNDEILVTQGLEENVYVERPEASETDYTKTDKTDRKINQAYIIVDKQNQEINAVVQNVDTISQLVDSQGEEINALGTRVTQNIENITASVTAIQSEINEGVGKVKTTSATLDDSGLSISTDTSKISTQITNNSFEIKDSGNNTLAFFGYDELEGISKAEMDNLTVTNYFVAGVHRIEKYEENFEERTGFFYIGG